MSEDLQITPGNPLAQEITATKWAALVDAAGGAQKASGAGRVALRPGVNLGLVGSLFVEEICIHIERPKQFQKLGFGLASPVGAYVVGFAGDCGGTTVSILGSNYVSTLESVEYNLLPDEARGQTGQPFNRWAPSTQTVGDATIGPAKLTRVTADGHLPDKTTSYLHIDDTDGKPIDVSIWIAY